MSAVLPASSRVVAVQAAPPGARLRGIPLALAWAGWSALTLLSVIDFISSIATHLSQARVPCQPSACLEGQPSVQTTRVLERAALSGGAYLAISVGLVVLTALIYCTVAAVIIWRKPRDWMALLVTSTLITQGLYENNYLQGALATHTTLWSMTTLALGYISPVQVLIVCALFPTGRFAPRWMGWLVLSICLVGLPPSLFPFMPL